MQARNRKFGKLVNGSVQYAPNNILVDGVIYAAPTAEQYLTAGWKSIVDHRLPPSEGYSIVADGWDEQPTKLIRIYRYEQIHRTEADFDAAMEEHIRRTREERGYTTREPSEYISSSVARWAQDAADFVRFRDEVMVYGLAILNEWKATGIEPSYDEFVANLPKIKWTEA